MSGRTVAVCGGRSYADRTHVFESLDVMHNAIRIGKLVTGGAPGADYLAEQWAIERGVPYDSIRADWERHGRAAGPIRNQQVLDTFKPRTLFAFPGGKGTFDMMTRAKASGCAVVYCKPPSIFEVWP